MDSISLHATRTDLWNNKLRPKWNNMNNMTWPGQPQGACHDDYIYCYMTGEPRQIFLFVLFWNSSIFKDWTRLIVRCWIDNAIWMGRWSGRQRPGHVISIVTQPKQTENIHIRHILLAANAIQTTVVNAVQAIRPFFRLALLKVPPNSNSHWKWKYIYIFNWTINRC